MTDLGVVQTRKRQDDDDGSSSAAVDLSRPQKKFFRTRAHSNVLNANDFWYPAKPSDVPWGDYFPGHFPTTGVQPAGQEPRVDFVDIGCGYGSLLIELAKIFPTTLMLGIEIRPKVAEYVQRKAIALRHETRARANGEEVACRRQNPGGEKLVGAGSSGEEPSPDDPSCENVWAVHNNAMRFLPNFFDKGQLGKLFFCFADPHFKRKNHRKRIISQPLLSEYAYVLKPQGLVYVITDVSELMIWMVGHLQQSPLFEQLDNEALRADPTVPALIRTDEGLKVTRNNGNMYIAVFRKRLDPLAPKAPALPNDNVLAAAAAADAGYTPKAGGERRGMTW